MSLSVQDLDTPRQWKSSIGMNESKFRSLLVYFEQAYIQVQGISITESQSNLKQDFAFGSYEEFLFFILFVLKNPTTYDVNGLVFGISQSGAETNFKRGVRILKKAFELSLDLPSTEFKTQGELLKFLNKQKRLKIDVTEIWVQRPKDKEEQKAHYSGKKKTHS